MKLFLLFLFGFFVSFSVSGVDIKTMYVDQPPKFKIKDGVVSGLSIDLMRAIEKVDGTLHFVSDKQAFTPIARLEDSLLGGDIDAYFGFVKNPDRAAKFNMTLELFPSTNIVVSLKDVSADFKTLDELKALTKGEVVLAVSGSAQAQLLKKEGFRVDDGAPNVASAIDKLLLGRAKFLMVLDLAAFEIIKEKGIQDKVKVYPSVTGRDMNYLTFSKKTPQATVDAVAAALGKVRSSGVLDTILARYGIAK